MIRLVICFLLAAVASCWGAPTIAIFDEPDFPFYMASANDSPRLVEDLLQTAGLDVVRVSAQQLGDSATFNADEFAVCVFVHGNTFPLEAFRNLTRFHEAGGSLVLMSGVPFCHPVVAKGAAGWPYEMRGRNMRVLDDPHSGNAALRVHNADGDGWTGPACRRFAVTPGEQFTVGGHVRVDDAMPAHEKSLIYLRFYDQQGQFIGQSGPAMPNEPTGWTRIALDVQVIEGAATADVSPQLWNPNAELLIDDLFLFRANAPDENLLPNPSFESASGGWTDLEHDGQYQTHATGIGTGGFTNADEPGALNVSQLGERIGLNPAFYADLPAPSFVQVLDPGTLDPKDEVLPLISAGDAARGIHPAVMIKHACPRFDGAIDVWGRSHCGSLEGRPLYHVLVKSTISILAMKSLVTPEEARTMVAKIDGVLGAEPVTWEPVQEPRPFDTVWPRSTKPADNISVCDVSSLPPEDEFALTVLQGLVNRTQPRLYLLHSRYARQDQQWLDELEFEGLTSETITPEEVWERYGDVAKGAVVYDRAILEEIGAFRADRLNLTNVVLMLCSVNDAVPVAVEAGEEAPGDRPVILDTRDKWETPFDMQRWAYDNLWPEMNHHILATLYPGIFYLTDYLVQHRIFTFWFGSERTLREQELLEQILASTPPNTPIVGWWFCWMPNVQDEAHRAADCVGEGEGVRIGSMFGKFLTPSHECTNLSVHSGMPLLNYTHKPVSAPAELDPSKVYYSFIMSDGDNLGECLMMRRRDSRWDVPERGKIPMGWSQAPASAVLAPPVLNYYLRTATEHDYLVGGLGIAYTQPDPYATAFGDERAAIFTEYARMTADSLAPLDTGSLWLIGGSKPTVSRYAQAGRPLTALFPDYGTGVKRPYERVTYMDEGDVAVFRAVTGWGGDEDYADRLVREITQASDDARPAFLHVFLLNWGTNMPMLQRVMDRLGEDYICVRPDELDRLFHEAQKP